MYSGLKLLRQAPYGEAYADQTGRELIQIGLAERYRARIQQSLHHGGRFLRHIGVFRTARGRSHSRKIDIVLDGKGNPIQRQILDTAMFDRAHIGHHLIAAQAGNPDIVG